jgi:hypothetical protein
MHINSHFAVGMIFSAIFNYFLHFSLFEYTILVTFSFICDFDVFLSKYAKDHNHRMLISHSIIPSIIIIIMGLLINWPALYLSGLTYAIHIFIDTFDWGTNFFFFNKKQFGLKLLISKEELENLPKYLMKYQKSESFFDSKYYNNKYCLWIEYLLFIFMLLFVSIFALQYIWLIAFYFIGLYFHLSRHFNLKKIEALKIPKT